MRKYADVALGLITINGTAVTEPIAGASVQILNHVAQTNAVIYSDDGVTTTGNPLTADAQGRYQFYVANGRYDIKISATGFTTFTLSDIDIHDETDITVPGATPLPGNLIFSGTNTHSGSETFTGAFNATKAATFSSGIPWFDVTGAPFNAACNDNGTGNGTDDTAALQAAITAAIATGGSVVIPEGKYCRFTTTLNMNVGINISISGGVIGDRARLGSAPGFSSGLVYTGTTSPAISAQSSAGVNFDRLQIIVTNASFAGTVIDTSHSTSSDSQKFVFQNSTVVATGTSCNVGLSLDKTDNMYVYNSSFFGCAKIIRGAAGVGSTSNVVEIKNTSFNATSNTVCYICNPGANWLIEANDFEVLGNAVSTVGITDGYTGPVQGFRFISNFDGDNSGTATRTHYALSGVVCDGCAFKGNTIGGSSANDSVFNFGNNSRGLEVCGNTSNNTTFGTYLTVGTGVSIDVCPQYYQNASISTFLSGTPASGIVWDNSNPNNLLFYGSTTNGLGCANNIACIYAQKAGGGTATLLALDGSNNIDIGAFNSGQPVRISGGLTLLLPSAAGTIDVGSTTLPFDNLWLGTAATNNFKIAPQATTGARIIQVADFGVNGSTTQQFPYTTILTSQYTNSTTGFTTVAGGQTFQFPVLANTNYTAECHLYYQAASTGGLNIQFTGPASPTAVSYGLFDPGSATTIVADAVATAFGTSLGAAVTTATTNFDAIVSLGLVNGANAGTVVLQAKSSAAVQLQIQTGSFCKVQ